MFRVLLVLVLFLGFAPSASAVVVFNGNYNTGNFNQWDGVHQGSDGDCCKVVSKAGHATVGKFMVEPGDKFGKSTGERAEVLKQGIGFSEGHTRIIKWATYFPRGFKVNPHGGSWNIFTQIHQAGDQCPPVSGIAVREDYKIRVAWRELANPVTCSLVQHLYVLGKLHRGRWLHFKELVRFSAVAGHVIFWYNGHKAFEHHFPTLYPGQNAYLKQGFYRGPANLTTTVFHDNTRVLRP